MRRTKVGVGRIIVCAAAAATVLAGCGGGPSNDPLARDALIRASEASAGAKSYVAVVNPSAPAPVTFTYVAPDRLRVQQGTGKSAVVVVQVALAGYHSDPKRPGRFTKRLENVAPDANAPLGIVSSLITRSTHVARRGNAIRFDVAYGHVTAHLLVHIDPQGLLADAELPVFDKAHKVVSYKEVAFAEYNRAPAVVPPSTRLIAGG